MNFMDEAHSLADVLSKKFSLATLYEQMAEEAIELAHACQKKARKLRGENFTPISMDEIDDNLKEEYTDLWIVKWVVFHNEKDTLHDFWGSNGPVKDLFLPKLERWRDRNSTNN